MTDAGVVALAAGASMLLAPSIAALVGRARARGGAAAPRDWQLTLASALAFTLAFNLTFLLQELFLVLPKAFTPGLHPTLFHNNHTWSGTHPLENLFQATGAAATFVSGVACAAWLSRGGGRSWTVRLVIFWMAYCGIFMALPQVVIGAISDASDLGRAFGYFGLGREPRLLAAFAALIAMPPIAVWLSRTLLARGPAAARASPAAQRRWMLHATTLPAFIGVVLVIPFRIPREWIEVAMVPFAVVIAGVPWMQAMSWRSVRAAAVVDAVRPSIMRLVVGALLVLLVFQLVLRPGVRFY
jgi:hypothetical protein